VEVFSSRHRAGAQIGCGIIIAGLGKAEDWIPQVRMRFEIVGNISEIETIAVGRAIRILPLLRKRYGEGRWRKMKGVANVRLSSGRIRLAELHWYEAHGIGRKEIKRKKYLD